MPNGTCRFIVFDFDNHEKGAEATDFANTDNEWHKEVDALRKICELNGIKPLVERSRSGKGAHVWFFFKKAILVWVARNFGFLLLDKGSDSINLKSFHYYDRMYPAQDVASSIGNLIALPLQGQALKSGNSAFVDENWNAYPNQWDSLFNKTEKLSIEDIERYMTKWQGELAAASGIPAGGGDINSRPKPWKKKCEFVKVDVVGKLHMTLSNGVYIDTLNLMPRIQNQIRSLQYVGRLNRDYEGKQAVYVYDYIDSHMHFFDKMYAKRLRTYKRMGFSIWTGDVQSKQIINAIYDSGNYIEKFELDIVEAEKMIVISSPEIRQDKIERLLFLARGRQEAGVKVTVITTDPEYVIYGNPDVCYELINEMRQVGIHVITKAEVEERFSVIDDELVWHGGMNLLGKVDIWDNLMRIKEHQVAAELLEIALGVAPE